MSLFLSLFFTEYVDLTRLPSHKQSTKYWIKDLQLFTSDKESLVNEDWLTDSIISAGKKLLKDSFSHMGGLEPTTLGHTLGFSTVTGEFVQILHVSNSHWLTVSNIVCPNGHVNVYDSIPSGDITGRTKMQIAAILFTDEKKITIDFPAVQIQNGGSDCGLFVLAFTAILCEGENPSEITYM